MKNYQLQLVDIEKEIESFFSKNFADDNASLSNNRKEKGKINSFILEITSDVKKGIITQKQRDDLLEKALKLLGKYTGCTEDMEVADEILDNLLIKNFITKDDLKYFTDNTSINRWG